MLTSTLALPTGFVYMKLNALLPLTVCLILLSSCAKTPGKTDAKFKLSIGSLTDFGNAGAGGAMLWGKSDKGDAFGVNVSTNTGINLELSNGSWTFWSVAWEGKNNIYNFQGLTRCAKSTSVFNGADAQININLSNATCADTDFSPSVSTVAGAYEFPLVSRRECNMLSDHNGFDCGGGIGSNAKSSSRRLLMPSFKKVAGGQVEFTGSALVSYCHSNGSHEMIDTHLPVGNGAIPAFTVLESFFTSTVCDETDPKGFVKENFEIGLKATVNPNAITFINNGQCNGLNFKQEACTLFGGTYSAGVCSALAASTMADISESACILGGGSYTSGPEKRFRLVTFIPEDIFCSGKRIDPTITTPTIFAAGTGVGTSPYRICKEYQLNSIGAGYADKLFALNADLDMNATSIFGDQPMAACLSTNPGANFIPIGGMYDSNCNEIAEVNFGIGGFNGKNHTISNIRLHSKLSNIGFIRAGGSVSNLVLNNIEVEGVTNVGAFSGETSGALSNLLLTKGKIRGKNAVGGIVGGFSPTFGTLNNVNVKKSLIQIDGYQGRGGGLVGDTSNFALELAVNKSSFEGVISANGSQASVGGLIGTGAIAPLTINESYSSGAMLVHGSSWAGGLVGTAGVGIKINNSYSRMNIAPETSDIGMGGKIGGLVGMWAIEATVTNSFFHGSIMHPCFEQATPCSSGALSGGAAVTKYNSSGALLFKAWYNGVSVSDSFDLATFESTSNKNNFINYTSPPLFKNVGASFLRLAWETGPCAQDDNNQSVAVQSLKRGAISNPIILCNKEQWAEIKNYPALNYTVADNLGIGEINAAAIIPSFSGSINGDGYVIGGIYNFASESTSGIIANNYGKISNAIFAASYLKINGQSNAAAGMVGINKASGQIIENQFLSVNIKDSISEYTGVVAGQNYGSIHRNRVSSISSIAKNGGLLVGTNMSSGVMTGNRVKGILNILAGTNDFKFGLVAASNAGKISETDVSGTLINSAGGNTGSGSSIGAFLGINSGTVEDILIRPYTRLVIGINGPTYAQAIGEVVEGATVKNVLALNEVPLAYSVTSANIQSFAGFSDSAAHYKNSYMLKGSVFRLASAPVTMTDCAPSGSNFSYILSAPLALSPNYKDGFYLPSVSGSYVSSRITGNLPNGITSFTPNINNGDFVLPCEASGVVSGTTNVYPYGSVPDFSEDGVKSLSLLDLKSFNYFCPSGACNTSSGDLDMVEDAAAAGFGYTRLYNAHKFWLMTGYPPEIRPKWVMSDEGYPKLFIVD
jgi:hypothetical protein